MKCLLVSYGTLATNSTSHTTLFARGLAAMGWSVQLAATSTDNVRSGFDFYECPAEGALVPLSEGIEPEPADIVHVWTPRAPIWRFLEQYRRLIKGALLLHLEDDEDEILAFHGAENTAPGGLATRESLRRFRLEEWSHPVLARCLARSVDGVTMLSPELSALVPAATPSLHVFPPLGPEWRGPRNVEQAPPAAIGNGATIVFSGAVHPAVEEDFLELCRAVGALVSMGRQVTLVRCGQPERRDLLLKAESLARNFRDLGFLPAETLRALLESATVLVQPGGPTRFNRRRLPAKLVSYLASGAPVVMPACYEWLGIRAGEHVVTTSTGKADELATAISSVLDAPENARAMGARAAALARKLFCATECCRPLDAFFHQLAGRSRTPWRLVRKPRVELPLMLAPANDASLPAPAELIQVALEEIRHPAVHARPLVAIAQLFWPTLQGYDEKASVSASFFGGRWQRVLFGPGLVPADLQPRFDPTNHAGTIEIATVTYRGHDRRLLRHWQPPGGVIREMSSLGSLVRLDPQGRRVWRWFSANDDPQLLLPAPGVDGAHFVECWMRWTPVE